MSQMRRLTLGSIAVGLLVLAGFTVPASHPGDPHPECPHEWNHQTVAEGRSKGFPVNGRLSVPGITTSVPEFHDCQRLIVKQGGRLRYGSMSAVFARAGLTAATDSAGGLEAGIAVAEVYAEGPYPKLNIRQGFNCLYLQLTPSGYTAFMIPVGANERRCARPLDTSAPGTRRLSVRKLNYPVTDDFAPKHIPPVARWDWSPRDSTQYIGIRCRKDWCEVHEPQSVAPTFASSPQYASPAGGSEFERRVIRVKGWYDQQYLAEFNAAGQPVPGIAMATIFPASGLDTMTASWFAAQTWVPVAYASMPMFRSLYAKKFSYGMASAPPGATPRNELAFCMGSPQKCGIDPAKRCTGDTYARVTSSQLPAASFTGAGAAPTELRFCVVPRPFSGGFSIPGVVRWRWRATDETIWARCPSGCCEVDETNIIGP